MGSQKQDDILRSILDEVAYSSAIYNGVLKSGIPLTPYGGSFRAGITKNVPKL